MVGATTPTRRLKCKGNIHVSKNMRLWFKRIQTYRSTITHWLECPTVSWEVTGSIPVGTSIFCSISIVASASDFLSEDKGSIPLWSTK